MIINSNNKFFVSSDEVLSVPGVLNCGVLEGSIFFLLYVNDLPKVLTETGFYVWADNTCVFDKYKDFLKIEVASNKQFSTLCLLVKDKKLLR